MDKYDIPFLIRDIKNKMPVHNENSGRVPYTFKRLPKNLMVESNRVNNKFLNNHLAEIEEVGYKNKLTGGFKQWFFKQQSHHKETTNHDGFFTKIKNYINNDMNNPNLACGFLINPYLFAKDITLESGIGAASYSVGSNFLVISKLSTGVINDLYNRVGMRMSPTTVAGNNRMGVYTTTTGEPSTLYQETASHASLTGFNWNSLTEFAISTTVNWTAWVSDTGAGNEFSQLSTEASGRRYKSWTFGALQSPLTALTTDNFPSNTKLGHS